MLPGLSSNCSCSRPRSGSSSSSSGAHYAKKHAPQIVQKSQDVRPNRDNAVDFLLKHFRWWPFAQEGQYPDCDGKFCAVDTHPMPLTILGSGRSGLPNKFACLVHVCKLEISGNVSRLQTCDGVSWVSAGHSPTQCLL